MLPLFLFLFWGLWGGASQVAQWLRIHQPMQEMPNRSLGWEDPQGEEMATHSSSLAWKIPWTQEPGGLQSKESQRVRHDSNNWACVNTYAMGFTIVHLETRDHSVLLTYVPPGPSPGAGAFFVLSHWKFVVSLSWQSTYLSIVLVCEIVAKIIHSLN